MILLISIPSPLKDFDSNGKCQPQTGDKQPAKASICPRQSGVQRVVAAALSETAVAIAHSFLTLRRSVFYQPMLRRRSTSSSSMSQDGGSPTRNSINPSPSPSDCRPLQSEAAGGIVLETQSITHKREGISDWEAGVSLAKAIMGAGSFALPWAFSKMGYLAGPMVLVVFLGLSVHSIGLLVDCARWLRNSSNNHHSSSSVSYVDVARATFGLTGAALAYASSIASSIGVCGSYLVFVAVNLSALLGINKESSGAEDDESASGIASDNGDRRLFFILVWTVALPIAVLLSSVRNPKRFAEVSMWGDLSVVAGMLAVVIYGIAFAETSGENNETKTTFVFADCVAIGSLKDMALALGSIGYLFLVHFLVLPIESSMEGRTGSGNNTPLDPEAACAGAEDSNGQSAAPGVSRDRFQNVVVRTFLVCGGIGGTFGIIGYFLFGTNTQQIVLLNVEGSIGMAIVQSLLCIDLLLTYPVVMRPSISILEEHWKVSLLKKKKKQKQGENDGLQMVALVSTPASKSCDEGSSANIANLPSGGDNHHQEADDDESSIVVLSNWNHMTVCLSLGVVAAGAGSFVPAFGLLSGLVGGVSQTFLSFVLPPLMWAKKQQLQLHGGGDETSAWACFVSLPWKEKALVLCGMGLIGWTLQSTWAELGSGEL